MADQKECKMKTLILLRGLPGAGKSTFANFIWESNAVFEADKYFYNTEDNYKWDGDLLEQAHQWCKDGVEGAMITNHTSDGRYFSEIVVSNTLTTEKEIEPYMVLAEKYGYTVVSLIVENRHGNSSRHNVPKEALTKMKNRFAIKL